MPTKKTTTTPTKKTATKVVAKKPVEKKVAVKKTAEKKIVAKPKVEKKPAVKVVAKKPVEKKVAVKKTAEKKPAAKVVTKKTVEKKTVAEKKPATKIIKEKTEVAKKSATKKTSKSGSQKTADVKVVIVTNIGNIELTLESSKAPITVLNFLKYISIKHYDGLIFHRVIADFMIQGGGYDDGLNPRPTLNPIRIESNNGLKNSRATIAMARTNEPNSATSQFFINLVDNNFLDFKEETRDGYGYTVFGKVTKGMDIVDKVGSAPTSKYMHHESLPINVIRIETMKVI